MATAPRVAMRAVRNLYGSGIPREEFKEKATQTFKMGAVLKSNGGFVDEAAADPLLVLGVAQADGGNGATDGAAVQRVDIAMQGILFMGNLSNAGDTAVTAQTDVMVGYGIAKDATSGKWYVDKGDVTAKRVKIWGFWLQDLDVLGDTRGRVTFVWDPDFCEALQA